MTTLSLARRLTVARLSARIGDAWLDTCAVLSFLLSSFMALTVSGGIWMFYRWAYFPSELNATRAQYANDLWDVFTVYFVLALFAGALLVIPIFSLASQAVRLGAQGRSERLASLRLIGTTRSQTIVISLAETCIQWILGTAAGVGLYFLTLPLWNNVSFGGSPISYREMILPLHFLLLLLLFLFLTALTSGIFGLMRVNISPLGVAKKSSGKALSFWRLIILLLVLIMFFVLVFTGVTPTREGILFQVIISVVSVSVILGALSFAGGFILQVCARLATYTHHTSVLIAARRIIYRPVASWRSIGSISLLSFIGGFISFSISWDDDTISIILNHDILTGVIITIVFGFMIAALSTFMNQASEVCDRLPQTRALKAMGFPADIFGKIRIFQNFVPLLASTLLCAGLGRLISVTLASASRKSASLMNNVEPFVWTLGGGICICLLAILLVTPLERKILKSLGRDND